MSKKNILTGYVHRLEYGVLKTYAPGDIAPAWVTNQAVLRTENGAVEADPAAHPDDSVSEASDEYASLTIKQLKELAKSAGVATSGSKQELADRLRAKREAAEPDADIERDALIARAKELGVLDADDLTDSELEAVIELGA